MAYAPVLFEFFDNDKYIAAVERDARTVPLHFWAIAYANKELTDGFVPAIQVRRRVELGDPLALAAVLVEVGLWESAEGGFRIHDFLEHNSSAAEVKQKRVLLQERVNRWRVGKRGEKTPPPEADPSFISDAGNGVTNAEVTRSVTRYERGGNAANASANASRSTNKQAVVDDPARPSPTIGLTLPADWDWWVEDALARKPTTRETAWLLSIVAENHPPPCGAELGPLLKDALRRKGTKNAPAVVCLMLRDQSSLRQNGTA